MLLVDTSVWIHALRRPGSPKIQELLKPLLLRGEAATTEWIILELMTGIRTTEKAEALSRQMEPLHRFSFGAENWLDAWMLAAKLRKQGVSPSASDCFISTVAIAHNIELAHCDGDFEAIAKHSRLRTLDWTSFAS